MLPTYMALAADESRPPPPDPSSTCGNAPVPVDTRAWFSLRGKALLTRTFCTEKLLSLLLVVQIPPVLLKAASAFSTSGMPLPGIFFENSALAVVESVFCRVQLSWTKTGLIRVPLTAIALVPDNGTNRSLAPRHIVSCYSREYAQKWL
jgi:hypothetical protein